MAITPLFRLLTALPVGSTPSEAPGPSIVGIFWV